MRPAPTPPRPPALEGRTPCLVGVWLHLDQAEPYVEANWHANCPMPTVPMEATP